MPTDLPKQYDPKPTQDRWYAFWEERGFFNADPNPAKTPHTIMIPLPNVTGALHMGHALNGTLQDLLTRWRRMQGYEALWMPGTDHAGIATQAVVERRMLEEEGLTRHDIGREALVKRIWKWKDAYEQRILSQLKQLGASCDWRRTRFTLDEVCSRAVRRTFFKLFRDGLIYRGKRLVNWDPYLQTAVADDEVFHEEVAGHFWTFSYPVVGSDERISFSTTRPETMLGDTAVCVHPADERYRHLVGQSVRVPLVDREIPIIADALLADMEMGTGAVKVTPAHDPNDYACAQRNNLPMINILNPNGTLNENAGPYKGLTVAEAREKVVERMRDLGHFETVEDRVIDLAHSDRSKTPIEPYLSDQWFVKMDELAEDAMQAVRDGRVTFFPARYARTYHDWLGEKRDWCISRQLWWGHRIPIWRLQKQSTTDIGSRIIAFAKEIQEARRADELDEEHAEEMLRQLHEFATTSLIPTALNVDAVAQQVQLTEDFSSVEVLLCVDDGYPEIEAQLEAAGFDQDPDVLDTWFSSALWPHATLGWPDREHNPPLSETGIAPQGVLASSPSTLNPQPSTLTSPPSTLHPPPSTNSVLHYFYPGSVLVTSRDIITLWVARMVLTGLYNMGDVPFHHVCIHPKILDGFGQTMSKSKGNGVDPMDLIDKYGTDAVRFTIASLAGETQDVRLPVGYEDPETGEVVPQSLEHQKADFRSGEKPRIKFPKSGKSYQFSSPWYDPDPGEPVARMVSERFDYGRNFSNKLWNASRFAILNLDGHKPGAISEDELRLEDRWILSRLSTTAAEVTRQLEGYHFDFATRGLRDFTWSEFCDWYLEMIKPRLKDDEQRPVAQRMLVGVLDALLRLLQPFTPFIAEELWQRLNELAPKRGLLEPEPAAESVMIAPWPDYGERWQDRPLESRFERLQETIIAVRNVRAVYGIPPTAPLELHIRCAGDVAADLSEVASQFDNLAKTTLAAAGSDVSRPQASASFALTNADGFIPLEGVIDRRAELAREKSEAAKLRVHIAGHEKKLTNENFTNKAPAEVVNKVRETLTGLRKQLESIEQIIDDLSAD